MRKLTIDHKTKEHHTWAVDSTRCWVRKQPLPRLPAECPRPNLLRAPMVSLASRTTTLRPRLRQESPKISSRKLPPSLRSLALIGQQLLRRRQPSNVRLRASDNQQPASTVC